MTVTVTASIACVVWQVKRVAGASGRMRKNDEGEWEWSDDGECADDYKLKTAAAPATGPVSNYL